MLVARSTGWTITRTPAQKLKRSFEMTPTAKQKTAAQSRPTFPPMPIPENASDELLKALVFAYNSYEEFANHLEVARSMFHQFPELVTCETLPEDVLQLAEDVEATLDQEVEFHMDFLDPEARLCAKDLVKTWEQNADKERLKQESEAQRMAEHNKPKTQIGQLDLACAYYPRKLYQMQVEKIQKWLAAGLPIEEGPMSIDLTKLNEPIVSIIKGEPVKEKDAAA
jgi:hypothetical protein